MVFTLQRRFLLLLLLPVTVILLVTGAAGFFWLKDYLLDQWKISSELKLARASHEIAMRLQEKVELITLIDKAQGIPNGYLSQAFLIQQLLEKEGVRFVDLERADLSGHTTGDLRLNGDEYGIEIKKKGGKVVVEELCDKWGVCVQMMDPKALDRALPVLMLLGQDKDVPADRLTVRVSFASFLSPIKQMQPWEGSTAYLVTGNGILLATTDKSMSDRKKLGDNGNDVERRVVEEMQKTHSGTILGKGRPPDVVAGFHKVPVESINWYVVLFSEGRVIMKPMVTFRFYYALAVVATILVILLVIRLTTRSVAQSVGQISSAAVRVQEGDYDVSLPEDRSDEIGHLCRSFNEMIEGLKQGDLIEQTFGRYVDKRVAQELMSSPDALRLGGERRTVTIMMADLRNFTTISEPLEPEEVIHILNRHFSRMIAVIERYRGIIVDFYGDSVLVFFSGPEETVPRRAVDAVTCALEMQKEFEAFVQENTSEGLPEIRMGIGIHTGDVIVGNIGTESRAKYGIVGSDVNLTDRIQSTATGGTVVISERTYDTIRRMLTVSREFNVCLKGLQDQWKLYEVEAVNVAFGDRDPLTEERLVAKG